MKEKNIIVLKNQGFCYGVLRAIKMCEENLNKMEKPIYMLGHLVHNKNVSKYFEEKGVTILGGYNRLHSLNIVNEGSVIITAHGVGSNVYERIKAKILQYFDTTCPFVKKSFDTIMEFVNKGYDCIYIGKFHHPETEAILSESNRIHLIEHLEDLDNLKIDNPHIVLSNQTTMSVYDIQLIIEKAKELYPHLIVLKTICNATKNRQKELTDTLNLFKDEDILVVVVGDKMSNNTDMLAKRASAFKNAFVVKIEGPEQLDNELLNKYKNIMITSGASTPPDIVENVIKKIRTL